MGMTSTVEGSDAFGGRKKVTSSLSYVQVFMLIFVNVCTKEGILLYHNPEAFAAQ